MPQFLNLDRLDRLLPNAVREGTPSQQLRGRWFVALVLVGSAVGAVHAGLGARAADPALVAVGLAWLASCMWFGSMIRAAEDSLRERAAGFTAVGIVGFSLLAMLDGGVGGGAVLFLALMPVFANIQLDRSAAMRAAGGVAVATLVLALVNPTPAPGFVEVPELTVSILRGLYLVIMGSMVVGLSSALDQLQTMEDRGYDGTIARLKGEIDDADQRNQEIEQSNLAKSVFLANISHELRTPLNAIVGMTESTIPTLQGPSREALQVVLESSQSLLALTDDLVDLSRIEAGRMRLDSRPFDLRRACENVVMSLAPAAAARNQSLVLDVDEDALVAGDESRVRQVLSILLQNAIKHADDGSVSVLVHRMLGQSLRFEVKDSGPGLDVLTHQKVFDAFERGDEEATGGPGLGLTIARAVCQCMGGTIGVDSSVGQGSTFWFELPLEEAGAPALPQVRMRVGLAVAENHPYRNAFARQLMLLGCDVVEPGEGPELIVSPMASGDGLECRPVGRSGHLEHIPLPWRRDELIEALRRFSSTNDGESKPETREFTKLIVDGPILVVEDNEVNRIVARRMLEALGCVVHTANDGFEALERLEAGAMYALVFMDIQMPGIDGYETTRRIRGMNGERLPIVALTANALPEHRAASLAAGMDDHVAKPVRRDVLAAALTRWAGAQPEPEVKDPFALV